MTQELKKPGSKIKYYHILILGCMLTPLIIMNSNYVNNQRAENKLNKENRKLFDKIISGRKLEGEEEPDKIDEVCNRGSKELNSYYKTGNLEEIELKEGAIKSEDKDKDYMKALINILKSQMKGDGDASEHRNLNEVEDEKDDKEEGSQISTDDVMAYGKHLLPVLVFLVVAILCIPGWLMCCFCCCCNCCCCCCCKKEGCKIPCFVIHLLYMLLLLQFVFME